MHLDQLVPVLREHGGIASRRVLLAAGFTGYQLTAAVRLRLIFRAMLGWYALPEAPGELVRAVRVGGCLAGRSAARLLGLATPEYRADERLHVWVRPGSSRLRSPDSRYTRLGPDEVVLHWEQPAVAVARDRLIVPVEFALVQMLRTESTAVAIAAIDSALRLGRLDRELWQQHLETLPPALQVIAARADGRSGGFPESLLRVWLEDGLQDLVELGYDCRIRIQAPFIIDGRERRLDLLIGERLGIEVDGMAYHSLREQIEDDRGRELGFNAEGVFLMRVTYRQILQQFPRILTAVRGAILRGDHRASAGVA